MTLSDDLLGFLRDPESQRDEDGQRAEDHAPTDNLLAFLTGEDETDTGGESFKPDEAGEWVKTLST